MAVRLETLVGQRADLLRANAAAHDDEAVGFTAHQMASDGLRQDSAGDGEGQAPDLGRELEVVAS